MVLRFARSEQSIIGDGIGQGLNPTETEKPSREDLSLPKWRTIENPNRNSQYRKKFKLHT